MIIKRAAHLSLVTIAFGLGAPVGAQQCEPGWHALGGVNDSVGALVPWDPDGPGPEPPLLIVGGAFTEAGGMPANHIASLDPTTGEWRKLGEGVSGSVYDLATLPDGGLVAAGGFHRAGDIVVSGLARWDGREWHPFGSGVSGSMPPSRAPIVLALQVLPSGDLIAGGTFTHAGGVEVKGIARWDGEGWHPLAGGTGAGAVGALALLPDGSLLAGDETGIVRWDEGSWARFGGGMIAGIHDVGSVVDVIRVTSQGDVVAGGSFSRAGSTPGTNRIARWNGSAWLSLGGGMAGGPFGLTWVFDAVQVPGGDLIAVGWFDTAGGVPALNIARWGGSQWAPMGDGLDLAGGYAVTLLPSGELVVGGGFQKAGGAASPHLAIWRDCPPCYADCDGDGELTFFDFLCFQNLFAAMDPEADCDGDTAFTFFDFLCFQNAFAAGCE